MKYSFLPILALSLLSACSGDNSVGMITDPDPAPLVPIELASGVTGRVAVVASRGQGVLDGFSEDLPISLLRIDQLSANSYPSDYLGDETSTFNADIAYVANEDTRRIRFGSTQYYPFDGRSTKFFGWYPQSGTWSATDAKVTFPAIDGSTDIRMAHGKEGSKKEGEKFSDTHSVLSFTHALTMVKVFIKAEKSEYIPLWGEVTKIEFVGKQQQCELVFPAAPSDATLTTNFTGSGDLQMVAKGGTAPHTDLTLTATDYVEAGYAMFAPHKNSTDNLQLRITADEAGVQPLVTIPYGEVAEGKSKLEPGKVYHIQLLFKAAEITPTGVIEAWTPGGTLPEIPLG